MLTILKMPLMLIPCLVRTAETTDGRPHGDEQTDGHSHQHTSGAFDVMRQGYSDHRRRGKFYPLHRYLYDSLRELIRGFHVFPIGIMQ